MSEVPAAPIKRGQIIVCPHKPSEPGADWCDTPRGEIGDG